MRPVSALFGPAVADTHQAAVQADLWYNGEVIRTGIPIAGGQVTSDDDQIIRGRLTCTIADEDGSLFPLLSDPSRTIGTYGHELHVRRGVVYGNGGTELVSLGWFLLQSVGAKEGFQRAPSGEWISAGLALTVEGLDRMQRVAEGRFVQPESPQTSSCRSEIQRLADSYIQLAAWPAIPDKPIPAGMTYGESRMEAIAQLASALGAQAYADADGSLALREVLLVDPDGDPDPVVTFETGTTLLSVTYQITRDGVYNAVVAKGERDTDQTPVQATAYEDTPGSPTRWGGPYGRVPTFFSSPIITSEAAAQAAARTRLDNLIRGRDRMVDVQVVPNPAIELGDTVEIVTPRVRFAGRVVAQTMPLTARGGAQQLRLRVAEAGTTVLDLGVPRPRL